MFSWQYPNKYLFKFRLIFFSVYNLCYTMIQSCYEQKEVNPYFIVQSLFCVQSKRHAISYKI